jgi:hypothetical protein
MGFRRLNIERNDPAACDATHRKNGVEHVGRMVIGGVSGGTRDFEDAVTAGEGLTDARAVAKVRGIPRK